MKKYLVVAVAFLLTTQVATQVFAQQNVVPSITSILQAHQNALKNLTFDWQLIQTTTNSAASSEQVERVRREAPERVRREIQRNRGITDEKVLNRFVEARVKTILQTLQGYSVSHTSIWHWCNHDNLTSIVGEAQDSQSLLTSFEYYFGDDWGIFVNTDNTNPQNGQHVATDGPSVWTNIKGTTYIPITIAPYVNVADAAFLMGYNPLNMYDVSWHLSSSNSKDVVLSAQIKQADANPIDIR